MSRLASRTALGLAAVLMLAGAASAAPGPADDRVVVVVKATDAELRSPEGARTLALRVRNAAAQACERDQLPISLRFSDAFVRCREAAIDRAIRDFGSPLLADALGRAPQVLARR